MYIRMLPVRPLIGTLSGRVQGMYVHVYVRTYVCAYVKLHTVGVGQLKHEEQCSLSVLVAHSVHVQQ